MKPLLLKITRRKPGAIVPGDYGCATCHLADICPPDDRCAFIVKVEDSWGSQADVLCWPRRPNNNAA